MILAKVNTMADALNASKGSLGLFINNPQLYNHAVGNPGASCKARLPRSQSGSRARWANWWPMKPSTTTPNEAIARLQNIVDQIDEGKGTVGKLVKDPSLYNNLNRLPRRPIRCSPRSMRAKVRWECWRRMRHFETKST